MTNEIISVLVVDDHAVVRQGVRAFLETEPHIEVVAEAESGGQALEMCVEHAPDVVLLDLLMPEKNGVEVTREIKKISPRTNIIILTSYHDDEYLLPAIQAGALSYLLKDVSDEGLVEAVEKAARGEAVLPSRLATRIIHGLSAKSAAEVEFQHDLTKRELEILGLVADGMTNSAIGEQLFISEKTVKCHVSNILSKLHLADRTQAAAFAWRSGIKNKGTE